MIKRWPGLVCASITIACGIYSFVNPFIKTFDEKYDIICGGIIDSFTDSIKFVKEFWNFNYNSVFNYLFEMRNVKCDNPFDISFA